VEERQEVPGAAGVIITSVVQQSEEPGLWR
jgi:hypothetical protein